jgi:hypothetical protein
MPKIAINVGWGKVTIDAICFNFRLRTDSFGWEETIEYSSLVMLDEAVRQSYDILAKIEFPVIDESLHALIIQNQTPGRSSSLEFFHLLERQRKYIEIWIICIFENISDLNGESREWSKQLFFRSSEKLTMFDQIYGSTSSFFENQSAKNSACTSPLNGTNIDQKDLHSTENNGTPAVRKKSVYTKVTHKLFKKRNKSIVGELSEDNLQENTTNLNQQVHDHQQHYTASVASGSKSPKVETPSRSGGERSPSKTPRSESDGGSSKAGGSRRFTIMNGLSFINHAGTSTGKLTALDEEEEQLVCAVYIDVQRGGSEEIRAGVLSYDISFRIVNPDTGKAVLYRTMQRYNNFKALNDSLTDLSGRNSSDGSGLAAGEEVDADVAARVFSNRGFMHLVDAPFPHKTTWFALTDSELSERTRSLDAWLREICMQYRHMPPAAKTAVRTFLNFDMSRQKDIFVQDQLAWGAIDAPSSGAGQASVLIVQRSALDSMSEDMVNQLETMSHRDGASPTPNVRLSVGGGHIPSISQGGDLVVPWDATSITPPGKKYT